MAQLVDHLGGIVVPGPFLELEAEPGKLLLEDPGALDVVGHHGSAVPVQEQQDRSQVAAHRVLTEVSARGEPGDRVGPSQHEGLVPGPLQELRDPAVLLLDVDATRGQHRIKVVGRRVGHDRQGVGVRAGRRRDRYDAVVIRVIGEVEIPGDRNSQAVQVDFGRHDLASLPRLSKLYARTPDAGKPLAPRGIGRDPRRRQADRAGSHVPRDRAPEDGKGESDFPKGTTRARHRDRGPARRRPRSDWIDDSYPSRIPPELQGSLGNRKACWFARSSTLYSERIASSFGAGSA